MSRSSSGVKLETTFHATRRKEEVARSKGVIFSYPSFQTWGLDGGVSLAGDVTRLLASRREETPGAVTEADTPPAPVRLRLGGEPTMDDAVTPLDDDAAAAVDDVKGMVEDEGITDGDDIKSRPRLVEEDSGSASTNNSWLLSLLLWSLGPPLPETRTSLTKGTNTWLEDSSSELERKEGDKKSPN